MILLSARKLNSRFNTMTINEVSLNSAKLFPIFCCRAVEDVRSVLTLFRRGAAQVCHVLRVEELREQLEVEEEDGDRQEEEEEVESGEVESRRVRHVDDHGWR